MTTINDTALPNETDAHSFFEYATQLEMANRQLVDLLRMARASLEEDEDEVEKVNTAINCAEKFSLEINQISDGLYKAGSELRDRLRTKDREHAVS